MNNTFEIELDIFRLVGWNHMGLSVFSVLLVSGLFVWGMFRRKHELVKKVIGAELVLLFLYWHLTIANICLSEMSFYIRAGVDIQMMIYDLCSYFSRVFVVSAISLYKLILFLLLAFRKRPIKQGDA